MKRDNPDLIRAHLNTQGRQILRLLEEGRLEEAIVHLRTQVDLLKRLSVVDVVVESDRQIIPRLYEPPEVEEDDEGWFKRLTKVLTN